MADVRRRVEIATQALSTLSDVLGEPFSTIVRDAAIQRFEYTFEAIWKAVKAHLAEIESIEAVSPKSAIRASFTVGLLDDASARVALEMADDRNLTSHTYNQGLADTLYRRLPRYALLLSEWLGAVSRARQAGVLTRLPTPK